MSSRPVNVRLAFNFAKWAPTKQQYFLAMSCIQPEERDRIRKFRYRSDAKASLIGRLLIRKWITTNFNLANDAVVLSRTERGRPCSPQVPPAYDFNVSHAGDYVVFAAGEFGAVGTDVMPLQDTRREEEIGEFFRLMRRKFTEDEWCQIRSSGSDHKTQLSVFFRLWCLKESFIKAEGTGLGIDLQSVSFKLNTSDLSKNVTRDTQFYLNGQRDTSMHFDEFLIDDGHCCAVCYTQNHGNNPVSWDNQGVDTISFDDVATGLCAIEPLIDKDFEWKLHEDQIKVKPF